MGKAVTSRKGKGVSRTGWFATNQKNIKVKGDLVNIREIAGLNRFLIVILCLSLGCGGDRAANSGEEAGILGAQDAKFRANLHNTGVFGAHAGVLSGKPVWTFQTGAGVLSSPAIAGGRLFFGSYDRRVYALK